MTTAERQFTSDKERVLQYQVRRPSFEEQIAEIPEPYALHSIDGCTLTGPVQLMVLRVINRGRYLLIPLTAYVKYGIDGAVILPETIFDQVVEQYPDISLVVGSIIEAELLKMETPNEHASHVVAVVTKIWDKSPFPANSPGKILQIEVEVDLSLPGRCRREINGNGDRFFVLTSRFGVEVSIPDTRLDNLLLKNMTIGKTVLKCRSIYKKGAPTPFVILDTCEVIKMTEGEEDLKIPARSAHYNQEDHSRNEEDD